MTKRDVVRKIRAVLDEAYEEAAYLVVTYVEQSGAPLQTFCREVCEGTPYSAEALRGRVQRLQKKAHADEDSTRTRALSKERVRHARSAIEAGDDDDLLLIVSGLTEDSFDGLHHVVSELAKTEPAKRVKVEKTFTQKFSEASIKIWKLQDELMDRVPDPAEQERLRVIARATQTFCEAVLRVLETGCPMTADDELQQMIEEAYQS